ncbi:hypothetical protein ALC56_07518 [Trachymyrmex septentrionalis]|uniref:Uncharacterized protein n=1 Tax=Trachymyrmex septentrionalis TaxID=34720 RepID=A0A195FCI2_9HYME|nr:hypothetical protein ALC56_07518 [Trachymyrmex septentrionalis]
MQHDSESRLDSRILLRQTETEAEYKILSVRRLNKRNRDPDIQDNDPKWVLSRSVVITFLISTDRNCLIYCKEYDVKRLMAFENLAMSDARKLVYKNSIRIINSGTENFPTVKEKFFIPFNEVVKRQKFNRLINNGGGIAFLVKKNLIFHIIHLDFNPKALEVGLISISSFRGILSQFHSASFCLGQS